jgi:hypothetical protein
MKAQFTAKSSDAAEYQDLTIGNSYHIIGIEADDFRIINDEGSPYLYPPHLFTIVDDHEPDDWITEYGEDGERYSYPPELNRVGFFEDYFDGEPQAITTFRRYLVQQRVLRSKIPKAV